MHMEGRRKLEVATRAVAVVAAVGGLAACGSRIHSEKSTADSGAVLEIETSWPGSHDIQTHFDHGPTYMSWTSASGARCTAQSSPTDFAWQTPDKLTSSPICHGT